MRTVGPDIETLRASALIAVDDGAGRTRALFLTVQPGQSSTYEYKLRDCQAYLADSNPDIDDYPWVEEEAKAQNMTPQAAAQNVVNRYLLWKLAGVKIEGARIKAKRLIREATTILAICAARDTALATYEQIAQAA